METIIQEKRMYKRRDYSLPLLYKNLREPGTASVRSFTCNISKGGVSFRSDAFMPLACRFAIEISLPAASRPVKAISKVVWIKKNQSTGQYELGSKFLDMAEEDRVLIADLKS